MTPDLATIHLSRRRLVVSLAVSGAGALLAACSAPAPAAPTATSAPPAPTGAPPAPTVAAAANPTVAPAAPAAKPTAPPAPTTAAAKPTAAAAAPSPTMTAAGVKPLASRAALAVVLNKNLLYLPYYYGAEKGYFQKAGLDVNFITYQGAAPSQFPLLLRGEVNLLPSAASPAFFNQAQQGFNIKVVTGNGITGFGEPLMMLIGKGIDTIKDYPDLKGKVVDGGTEGSGPSMGVLEAIKRAGLTPGKDVTLQFKGKTPADVLTMAQTNAADVVVMTQPTAAQAARQGFAKPWKALSDIAPWYQQSITLASDEFLQANRPAIEKFIEVYQLATREVNAVNGKWTPDLTAAMAKWTDTKPETFTDDPVPLFDGDGAVSAQSLQGAQDAWIAQNLVKDKVDTSKLIDTKTMDDVLGLIGKVGPAKPR